MITKPTTLILGAGASAPFGFPTGYTLLQKALGWGDVADGKTNPTIFKWLGIDKQKLDLFRGALSKSGKKSVDSFLEHRPEFLDVGKAVIALELITCEREHELFKRDGKSWYEYLFNELNTVFDDFDQNKLSILTFNYDRSLEHYLLTALQHSYGKPIGECAEKLKSIPIIHLHGDLGGLPNLGNESVRPYQDSITPESLSIAVSRIKIIHEDVEKQPQFIKAKEILSKSEVICFLGFGYHPTNLQRLGWNGGAYPPHPLQGTNLFCSSFGLTNSECNNVANSYRLHLRNSHLLDYASWDVLRFLRETGALQIR